MAATVANLLHVMVDDGADMEVSAALTADRVLLHLRTDWDCYITFSGPPAALEAILHGCLDAIEHVQQEAT